RSRRGGAGDGARRRMRHLPRRGRVAARGGGADGAAARARRGRRRSAVAGDRRPARATERADRHHGLAVEGIGGAGGGGGGGGAPAAMGLGRTRGLRWPAYGGRGGGGDRHLAGAHAYAAARSRPRADGGGEEEGAARRGARSGRARISRRGQGARV